MSVICRHVRNANTNQLKEYCRNISGVVRQVLCNHRKVEVGKNLWKFSSHARSATVGCSGLCPFRFWISPSMKTPHPLWVTYASVWPSSCKIVFSYISGRFPCISICVLAFCPVTEHSWEESDSSSIPSNQIFMYADKTNCTISSPGWPNHSSLIFSLYVRYSSPLISSVCFSGLFSGISSVTFAQ